jgi:hypothetical protein
MGFVFEAAGKPNVNYSGRFHKKVILQSFRHFPWSRVLVFR